MSGDQTSLNNYKSVEKSKACISHDLSPCENISSVCVGKNGSNFVYEITGMSCLQLILVIVSTYIIHSKFAVFSIP